MLHANARSPPRILSHVNFDQTEEGSKSWEQLILDNDTRWDTELMLLERVLYFDAELIQLYGEPELGIPPDCIFTREEFDLGFGMQLVLEPFRQFTKWAQYRNKVTTAFVPGRLDHLLNAIAAGVFDNRLLGRVAGTVGNVHALQRRLSSSVRDRFAPVFSGGSLALAARFLLPGQNRFQFDHFQVDQATLQQVPPSSPRIPCHFL